MLGRRGIKEIPGADALGRAAARPATERAAVCSAARLVDLTPELAIDYGKRPRTHRRLFSVAAFVTIGLVVFLLVNIAISYLNLRSAIESQRAVGQSIDRLRAISKLLSVVQDAETGQRGFLITGDEEYLKPYDAALAKIIKARRHLEHPDCRTTETRRAEPGAGSANQCSTFETGRDDCDPSDSGSQCSPCRGAGWRG